MTPMARFMKVSRERFERDWREICPDIPAPWDALRLPRRATAGAAGYDFFTPMGFVLEPGQSVRIPTGIRARIDEGWVLMLFPRSSLGFKYRLALNNTVGIVDSDYFGAENEGHIFIKFANLGDKPVTVQPGDAVAQGVFVPFGIAEDDEASALRVGGFGSTGR